MSVDFLFQYSALELFWLLVPILIGIAVVETLAIYFFKLKGKNDFKEWILNNISYDIYNIISEYNKIINEGFIPYLRNEWDTIFKLEDEPPHDYSGIINKTNLLKNKWRKHKKNIIEAIFIEDYKICPNPP